MKSNADNIKSSTIKQFEQKYKNRTLIYTLFDDGKEFELWVKVKGYGGYSEDLGKYGLNFDYAISDKMIEELTGEPCED